MASATAVSKPKCKYWDKCYRKSDDHKQNYLHPEDEPAGGSEEDSKPKNRLVGARIDLRRSRVVFTGTFTTYTRPRMVARAKMFGCVIQTSVGSDTDAVICGNDPSDAKQKAEEKGIKVYNEEEWEKVLIQSKPVRTYKASKRNKDATQCSDSEDEDFNPSNKKKRMPAGTRRTQKSSE